jgi:general secretion pathway protein D
MRESLPYGRDEGLTQERAGRTVHGTDVTVTADVNTNSIIVIAPPSVHQMYESLIQRLDVRRPQVQIECTIVTLDTSDQFSLAVDVGFSTGNDDGSIISFSSFGVSVVDPTTGQLTPVRGRGGTFALLSPGNADIVVRALSSNSRARLISAPQLLVNDNGKGQLKSVAQEPFAEIIDSNASQAITTFGGNAEAGTSIVVEPHISEDDYLQLTYAIELSSFTGTARQGLPPPSQSNSVDSTVTIPDGYTIVVGGLSTKNFRAAVDSIPGIDQIPLLKYLFGSRTRTTTDTTLFVFIRPTILRDDKFADLKYLSGRAAERVSIGGDFPPSNPIPMR